ncbi:hypothetical protein, partial [Methylobacterium radiotolerans]
RRAKAICSFVKRLRGMASTLLQGSGCPKNLRSARTSLLGQGQFDLAVINLRWGPLILPSFGVTAGRPLSPVCVIKRMGRKPPIAAVWLLVQSPLHLKYAAQAGRLRAA